MKLTSLISLVLVAAAMSGCAGGWRNGPPAGPAGVATPAQAANKPGIAAAVAATDGTRFAYKGDGNSVAVAGEFNAWNTTADPMAKQVDGSWLLVKKLDPGKYAYKFVIDGGTWKQDESAALSVDDGHGGKNSIVQVGDLNGGDEAGLAGGGTAAPTAPVAPTGAAVTGKGAAPVVTTDGVRFTFAGAADQVNLAGDFNSWSTTSDPMKRQPDGTWTITKQIAAGTFGYKFLINGKSWKQDESNSEARDDGFGGKNSTITVH